MLQDCDYIVCIVYYIVCSRWRHVNCRERAAWKVCHQRPPPCASVTEHLKADRVSTDF